MIGEKIANLLENCIFDGELVSENLDEKILCNLPEDFEYDWHEGASKLVIIPKNAKYVIKIPFTGAVRGTESEYEYEEFCAANSSDYYCWDYCLSEVLIWNFTKLEHVERAFAKEKWVCSINGHPIYIQQRAEIYGDSDKYDSASNEAKNKTINYCNEKNIETFGKKTLSWQVDALEYYGTKQFEKIMSFIEANQIDDLHASNLGYIDNRPVIVDYAGFFD